MGLEPSAKPKFSPDDPMTDCFLLWGGSPTLRPSAAAPPPQSIFRTHWGSPVKVYPLVLHRSKPKNYFFFLTLLSVPCFYLANCVFQCLKAAFPSADCSTRPLVCFGACFVFFFDLVGHSDLIFCSTSLFWLFLCGSLQNLGLARTRWLCPKSEYACSEVAIGGHWRYHSAQSLSQFTEHGSVFETWP